jgi:hypothetical protein
MTDKCQEKKPPFMKYMGLMSSEWALDYDVVIWNPASSSERLSAWLWDKSPGINRTPINHAQLGHGEGFYLESLIHKEVL